MENEIDAAAIKAADDLCNEIIGRIEEFAPSALDAVRLWMRITRSLITMKVVSVQALSDGLASIAEDILAEARHGRT